MTAPTGEAGARRLSICATNYNCGHALLLHLNSIYRVFDEDSFEYVCVDNNSQDASPVILDEWRIRHPNFRWITHRSSMGHGREIAVRLSSASHILVVDTDTVYWPILATFVERVLAEMPQNAVQAIYAGLFPRETWFQAGGRRDLNVGEDYDMWMRIWEIGLMRWCPVPMGYNCKEPSASNGRDYLSTRYSRPDRLLRLVRGQLDRFRLLRYRDFDLEEIWKANLVDFGLSPVRDSWFVGHKPAGAANWIRSFSGDVLRILKSD